jgi:hypothetical protein
MRAVQMVLSLMDAMPSLSGFVREIQSGVLLIANHGIRPTSDHHFENLAKEGNDLCNTGYGSVLFYILTEFPLWDRIIAVPKTMATTFRMLFSVGPKCINIM